MKHIPVACKHCPEKYLQESSILSHMHIIIDDLCSHQVLDSCGGEPGYKASGVLRLTIERYDDMLTYRQLSKC